MESEVANGAKAISGVLEFSISLGILLLVVAGLGLFAWLQVREKHKIAVDLAAREKAFGEQLAAKEALHSEQIKALYDKSRQDSSDMQRVMVEKFADMSNTVLRSLDRVSLWMDFYGRGAQGQNSSSKPPASSGG